MPLGTLSSGLALLNHLPNSSDPTNEPTSANAGSPDPASFWASSLGPATAPMTGAAPLEEDVSPLSSCSMSLERRKLNSFSRLTSFPPATWNIEEAMSEVT